MHSSPSSETSPTETPNALLGLQVPPCEAMKHQALSVFLTRTPAVKIKNKKLKVLLANQLHRSSLQLPRALPCCLVAGGGVVLGLGFAEVTSPLPAPFQTQRLPASVVSGHAARVSRRRFTISKPHARSFGVSDTVPRSRRRIFGIKTF